MSRSPLPVRVRRWQHAVVAGALVSSLSVAGLVGVSVAGATTDSSETTTLTDNSTSTSDTSTTSTDTGTSSGVSSSTSASTDATTSGS